MALSAQVLRSRPIETFMDCRDDQSNGTVTGLGDEAYDDWVSLFLDDPALDMGVDSTVPLASLSELPLADFEESDFTNLEGGECIPHPVSCSAGPVDLIPSVANHFISENLSSVCSAASDSSSVACFDDFICAFEKVEDPNEAAASGQYFLQDELVIRDQDSDIARVHDASKGTHLPSQRPALGNTSNVFHTEHLSDTDIPLERTSLETPFGSQDHCITPALATSLREPSSSGSSSCSASPPPLYSNAGSDSEKGLCRSGSSTPEILGVSNNGANPLCYATGSAESGLTQGSSGSSLGLAGKSGLNNRFLKDQFLQADDESLSFLVNNLPSEEAGMNPDEEITTGTHHGQFSFIPTKPSDSTESRTELQRFQDRAVEIEARRGVQVHPILPNRKRKAIDRKSPSPTPEYISCDISERPNHGACGDGVGGEDEEKRQVRFIRNRESAQLSRQRKKVYVDELEERVKTMASTIAELNNTIRLISAENINLRRQVGLFSQPPGGKPGAFRMAVPWIPVGAYPSTVMGERLMSGGSQLPLMPIPWLKSQKNMIRKSKNSKLDGEEKAIAPKAPKRMKKTAGVAMGFLFLFFLLLPFNWSFLGLKTPGGGKRDFFPAVWDNQAGHLVGRAGGRVLTSWNEEEGSRNVTLSVQDPKARPSGFLGSNESNFKNEQDSYSRSDTPEKDLQAGSSKGGWQRSAGCGNGVSGNGGQATKSLHGGSVLQGNTSGPLAASLFVPRNDKRVEIDGNLIIHSVLASDKAARDLHKSFRAGQELNSLDLGMLELDENGLAFATDLKTMAGKVGKGGLLQTQEMGDLLELGKAFAANSHISQEEERLHFNGLPQQWFMEGLAGPILSSGKCTEVFQFETSEGSHSSTTGFCAGATCSRRDEYLKNDTNGIQEEQVAHRAGRQMPSSKHRRVSYAIPLPPAKKHAAFDVSRKRRNASDPTKKLENEEGVTNQQTRRSSMVVSVLANPAQSVDEARLAGGSAGNSKVFVVVLIDGVKYVTYSCMLPSKGSQPQFVTG